MRHSASEERQRAGDRHAGVGLIISLYFSVCVYIYIIYMCVYVYILHCTYEIILKTGMFVLNKGTDYT